MKTRGGDQADPGREIMDFCAHLMSYCGGLLGAVVLVIWIVIHRRTAGSPGA